MKYYMINETDASGTGSIDFTYYCLSDFSTLDDAKEIYTEENPWIKYQECSRMKAFEIDESTYKAGVSFNNYNQVCLEAYNRDFNHNDEKQQNWLLGDVHNMFCTRKWAEMFAKNNKYVRVGYPKMHNVYKMDDKRNLHFVYHYVSDIDFRESESYKMMTKRKL